MAFQTGNRFVAIDEVRAEPVNAVRDSHRAGNAGSERAALFIEAAQSRFSVTIECCELVASKSAGIEERSAAPLISAEPAVPAGRSRTAARARRVGL